MTPKERAAMQQALEALERWRDWDDLNNTAAWCLDDDDAIAALREALKPTREGKYYYKDNACTADNADSPDCICWHDKALAEQEPVAVISEFAIGLVKLHANGVSLPFGTPLYAAPVLTKDLTDDEINKISINIANAMPASMTVEDWKRSYARAVIAADREKNK